MAYLWKALREEVLDTVDDFRQKGALGALRDAALDTADIATGASRSLWDGVRGLVTVEQKMCLRVSGIPIRGTMAPLDFLDGRIMEVLVVDVDTVSNPPRARVTIPGTADLISVPIIPPEHLINNSERASMDSQLQDGISSAFEGLKLEWDNAIKDVREKGAVGAMKDTARDAIGVVGSTAASAVSAARPYANQTMDIVGHTATSAVEGARSLASPLIDLDRNIPNVTVEPRQRTDDSSAPQYVPVVGGADAASSTSIATSLLDGIKFEWQETVQDIREKGAIGAVRDAAFDTVDIVSNTASIALNGARSFASPLFVGVTETDRIPVTVTNNQNPNLSTGDTFIRETLVEKPTTPPDLASPDAPATQTNSAELVASTKLAPNPAEAVLKQTEPAPSGDTSTCAVKQSLVSMRRSQFEKQGKDAEESKKEIGELID